MSCLICNRIKLIQQNENRFFVKEFPHTYWVLSDHQFYKGYSILLLKEHAENLHELPEKTYFSVMENVREVGAKLYDVFSPIRINYELLGNRHHHLHWHIVPRHADDPDINNPIWIIDRNIRYNETCIPNEQELTNLKRLVINC